MPANVVFNIGCISFYFSSFQQAVANTSIQYSAASICVEEFARKNYNEKISGIAFFSLSNEWAIIQVSINIMKELYRNLNKYVKTHIRKYLRYSISVEHWNYTRNAECR